MIMKLIFICTGNTCRSPMACGIFKSMLEKENIKGVYCDSAGTFVNPNEKAAPNAVKVCSEIGVDISDHRAKALKDVKDFDQFDMYIVMNYNQYKILEMFNIPSYKIYILSGGVPDPFNLDVDVYRKTRDSISSGLRKVLDMLKENGK